jgi:hypothetical protein
MALAPALLPFAKSLGSVALKSGLSYLSSELPTLAKYIGKATLLNGKLTPRQILEAVKEKALSKEGREELISGGQKATKVLGKIGHQGLSFANKLGLGGSLTKRLQSSLENKTNSIHEALGNINKINESYF